MSLRRYDVLLLSAAPQMYAPLLDSLTSSGIRATAACSPQDAFRLVERSPQTVLVDLVHGAGLDLATVEAINRRRGRTMVLALHDGRFTIDGLSTDGGAIPRNFLVRHGLMLVQIGAWTLRDFVVKSSVNPARMLRLPAKGHLGVGADADVTVVDLAAGRADWSLARGRIVLADGKVSGRGGMLLVSPAGESVARSARVSHEVIHREGWR